MPPTQTILAIDCACGPCSAALWQNGHILALEEEPAASSQSARLLPMIQGVLRDAGLAYAELDAVACTVGPGSFTGIRVGLAAARGICFAAGKPGIGISTLHATAYAAGGAAPSVLAVLRAGKGEWYHQLFSSGPTLQPLTEPAVAKPENIMANVPDNTAIIGNVEAKGVQPGQPRADYVAQLAATHTHPLPLTPVYIRPPDVTLPTKKP